MIMMLSILMLILMILLLMLSMNLLLSKKLYKNREKMSPFECGFDPMSMNRMPFSLAFYLIAIIFLIFDVEISMILPMLIIKYYLYYLFMWNMLIILLILLLGLFLEWNEGAMKWFK